METRHRVWPWLVVPVALAALVIGLAQPEVFTRFAYAAEKGRLQAEREGLSGLASAGESSVALQELSQAFRLAAGTVQPAVVNIDTMTHLESLQEQMERLPDSLREYFQQQVPENHPDLDDAPRMERGRGSGMIVDAAGGLILTNNHVVSGADEITVRLSDGRRRSAELVSSDTKTDLAVIRIDAENLHEVIFGDSDSLQVGDFVLAIGSPLGYSQSVSHGIVSAKGRDESTFRNIYTNFIQTDASINPGNSGGPLVNLRGEVVGMNTAIATRTGVDNGVGFAIPARQIKAVLPYLLAGEQVVRGYLGVVIQGVKQNRELAATFGWNEPYGVMVTDHPLPGGPAERAGLRLGDVILEVDGEKMESAGDLQETIARSKPNTLVTMLIWRDESEREMRVKVGRQPDDFTMRAPIRLRRSTPAPMELEGIDVSEIGLSVQTLDSALAERFGWEEESYGAVVVTVEEDGPAAEARLVVGDLIQEVQNDRVDSATGFRRAIRERLKTYDDVRLYVKSSTGSGGYRLLRIR
jgi:serine protease Do